MDHNIGADDDLGHRFGDDGDAAQLGDDDDDDDIVHGFGNGDDTAYKLVMIMMTSSMERLHGYQIRQQFSDPLWPVLLPVKAADKEELEVKIQNRI